MNFRNNHSAIYHEDLAQGHPETFDIVFLDPPFGRALLQPCYSLLEEGGWLSAHAHIYIETERTLKELNLPPSWQVIRHKIMGQVAVFLVKRKLC